MSDLQVDSGPQTLATLITDGIYKFAGYGSVLMIVHYLVPDFYPSLWPMFYTDAYLTIVGVIADFTVLPRLGNVRSLSLGFFGILFIVWVTGALWPNTHMTWTRALAITICTVPLEYALHLYVLRRIRPG